jgi:uncharacterized membrane protein (UPF0127 family)
MKLPRIAILLCIVGLIIGVVYYFMLDHKSQNWSGYKSMNYNLNGKDLHLLVADTQPKQEKGLMYVKKLDGYDGMIFIFTNKEYQTFWNQNTIADLDIYWINGDKVLQKDLLPSITKTKDPYTIQSPGVVDKVIEIIR